MSWSSEKFIGKAQLYVDRGLATDDDAVKAWWFHFAVEPMLRAMIATIHPVLLAHPQSVDALLAAVGQDEGESTVIRSRGMKELLDHALRLKSFTPEARDSVGRLVVRRNAECHGPAAAFEAIGESDWMPDFLRLATAFSIECGLKVETSLGKAMPLWHLIWPRKRQQMQIQRSKS